MLVNKDYIIAEAFSRKISTSRIPDSLITTCEIKYLKPILGVEFYNAVVATPASYITLMNFIKPMIAWYAKYMLLPELKSEVSDLGINKINIQSASNADEDTYSQTRNQALVIAEAQRGQLVEYLNDNLSSYPLYSFGKASDNKVEIVGGIIFRKPITDFDDTDDQWYKPS